MAKLVHNILMPKNRLVFIAVMVLAVAGASTFIFLDEFISISDGVLEEENLTDPSVETSTTNPVLQEYFERMCKNYDDQTFYNAENLVSVSMDSIEYEIVGGKLLDILHNENGNPFVILIDVVKNGSFTITIPKSIVNEMTEFGVDDLIVLINGEEASMYDAVSSSTGATFTIQLPVCGKVIVIAGSEYFMF